MSSYNRKVLGQIIKFRREEMGLTQLQLATMIEISRQAYINIEQGYSSAPLDRIISLNKILGVNLIENDLILRDGDSISIEDYNLFYQNAKTSTLGEQLERVANSKDKKDRYVLLPNGKMMMAVDMVEPYAEAGFLSQYRSGELTTGLEKHWMIVDKEHQGDYLAWRVKGHSMDDGSSESIPDKSLVIGRNIKRELWADGLHLHKWKYYIILHKEGIVTKEITNHDKINGNLIIHSLNPDKHDYPDYTIQIADCYAIYNIVDKTLPV